MNRETWEILYEMLGIIGQIAQTSGVYSKDLADRISALGQQIECVSILETPDEQDI